jgi:hypothetical protein
MIRIQRHHEPAWPRPHRARRGLLVVLSACGGDAADEPGPAVPAVPEGAAEASIVSLDAVPTRSRPPSRMPAMRFGVPESEVAVAGALRVVWSDGSLGCPEDGMMYTQALVDGYRLTLEVDGRRVEYHGQNGQPPFLCER